MSIDNQLTVHAFECIQSIQTITKEDQLLSKRQL